MQNIINHRYHVEHGVLKADAQKANVNKKNQVKQLFSIMGMPIEGHEQAFLDNKWKEITGRARLSVNAQTQGEKFIESAIDHVRSETYIGGENVLPRADISTIGEAEKGRQRNRLACFGITKSSIQVALNSENSEDNDEEKTIEDIKKLITNYDIVQLRKVVGMKKKVYELVSNKLVKSFLDLSIDIIDLLELEGFEKKKENNEEKTTEGIDMKELVSELPVGELTDGEGLDGTQNELSGDKEEEKDTENDELGEPFDVIKRMEEDGKCHKIICKHILNGVEYGFADNSNFWISGGTSYTDKISIEMYDKNKFFFSKDRSSLLYMTVPGSTIKRSSYIDEYNKDTHLHLILNMKQPNDEGYFHSHVRGIHENEEFACLLMRDGTIFRYSPSLHECLGERTESSGNSVVDQVGKNLEHEISTTMGNEVTEEVFESSEAYNNDDTFDLSDLIYHNEEFQRGMARFFSNNKYNYADIRMAKSHDGMNVVQMIDDKYFGFSLDRQTLKGEIDGENGELLEKHDQEKDIRGIDPHLSAKEMMEKYSLVNDAVRTHIFVPSGHMYKTHHIESFLQRNDVVCVKMTDGREFGFNSDWTFLGGVIETTESMKDVIEHDEDFAFPSELIKNSFRNKEYIITHIETHIPQSPSNFYYRFSLAGEFEYICDQYGKELE